MKGKDHLEKFILEHRNEFDSDIPSEHLWEKMSGKITPGNNYSWIWKAAAILFFGLSTYLLVDRIEQENSTLVSNEIMEFINAETYYNSMIKVRREELEIYIGKDSPYFIEFSADIAELDSIYSQLKHEFDLNNDDFVMEAMIKNLQLRIEVMDRQMQIIQKVQKLNKNKNEDNVAI